MISGFLKPAHKEGKIRKKEREGKRRRKETVQARLEDMEVGGSDGSGGSEPARVFVRI